MKKKTLKPANFLTATLACGLLLSQASFAGISGVSVSNSAPSSGSSGTSGGVTVKDGKKNNDDTKVVLTEAQKGISCGQDPNASKYFPQNFFQQISRDGSPISFEQRPDNKILVKFPPVIDGCGKFKPQLYQDPKTKNVTIMMVHEDGKTYGEYISCLRGLDKDGKPIPNAPVYLKTDEQTKEEKIFHDTLAGKDYSSYSYTMDYDFDKKADVTKSMKLSFGYPVSYANRDGYPTSFGEDKDVALPPTLCMNAEKVQPEITYLNEGRDVLIQKLVEACKSADSQKIADARKSIGNADALKDIADKLKSQLDAGYLVAAGKEMEPVFKRMTEIEDKLGKGRDSMSETDAKKLVREYADLTKELDTKLISPSIYRVDSLMKQLADMKDEDPRRKAITEEIKKLNEDIGKFAKKDYTSFSSVYSMMEKYAINDSAKTIEDIRLKSFYYARVSPVDGDNGIKAMTFEQANQKQIAGMQKFDKTLVDWSDAYQVSKGNTYPLQKTERERSTAIDTMNKRWYTYQQNEQKNYQKYCSIGMTGAVTNPVQCQQFLSGVDSRRNAELKKREKDLTYIKGRQDKFDKMNKSYTAYQKTQVDKEMRDQDSEPYASSYSSFEDNFSDRFPGYYGTQQSTAYNPSMYDMGGMSGSMNMGNAGMYNPQMVNPQAQVQQGQYMMQGNQSWPRI